MWLALEFILTTLNTANIHKKVLGVTTGVGLIIGVVATGVLDKAGAMDNDVRLEQARLWEEHNKRGEIILSHLNNNIAEIKAQINKIDGRVYDMHENIPRDKRKHR